MALQKLMPAHELRELVGPASRDEFEPIRKRAEAVLQQPGASPNRPAKALA